MKTPEIVCLLREWRAPPVTKLKQIVWARISTRRAPLSGGQNPLTDVVLVLGMHRSGTSAVAGTLTKLGCSSPNTIMPGNFANAKGYFESLAIMNFHEELLKSAGSNWRDWRAFNPEWPRSPVAAEFQGRAKDLFAHEFDGSALPVLKDPRICRFAPFWLDVLRAMQATPRIVMPIRSPLDVAQSLKRRNGSSLTHGLLLWLRHVLDAEAQTRGEARSIFTWEEFQANWRGVCGKIATETHLSWPRLSDRASHEIDCFLTKELVHHDSDQVALVAHADVHEWTLRTFEALLQLARNPLSNSAMATLDEVRSAFDLSSRMFGRVLIEHEVDLEETRGQMAELARAHADSLAAAGKRIDQLEHQRFALAQSAGELEGHNSALARRIAVLEGQNAALTHRAAEFERYNTEMLRSASWRLTRPLRSIAKRVRRIARK